MKKVIFTILVSVLLSLPFYNANAQKLSTEYDEVRSTKYEEIESVEYTRFKWNIANIGYPFPQGAGIDDPSSNFLFSTEPQYLIKNNIGISLKLEFASISKVNNNIKSGATAFSLMPTGIYYFELPKNNIRPWVSLGVGLATVLSIAIDPNTPIIEPDAIPQDLSGIAVVATAPVLVVGAFLSSIEVATGPSYSIRAGIDLWHITVALAYNINPPSKGVISSYDENFNLVRRNVELSNNYFGVTVGFFLGGGKKKK